MKIMNLVTVARQKITYGGESLYVLIPKILRDKWSPKAGDTILFLRESDESDVVIRIEKDNE